MKHGQQPETVVLLEAARLFWRVARHIMHCVTGARACPAHLRGRWGPCAGRAGRVAAQFDVVRRGVSIMTSTLSTRRLLDGVSHRLICAQAPRARITRPRGRRPLPHPRVADGDLRRGGAGEGAGRGARRGERAEARAQAEEGAAALRHGLRARRGLRPAVLRAYAPRLREVGEGGGGAAAAGLTVLYLGGPVGWGGAARWRGGFSSGGVSLSPACTLVRRRRVASRAARSGWQRGRRAPSTWVRVLTVRQSVRRGICVSVSTVRETRVPLGGAPRARGALAVGLLRRGPLLP